MVEILASLVAETQPTEWLVWPFLLTFGMLLACGVGFPLPEELPVVLSGLWVASPEAVALGPARWLMLPVCILGVVVGDGFLYGIGRYFGPRLFQIPFFQRLFPADKYARVQNNFSRYGVNILLFARLLPGIRGPIFITAGIMKLPLRRFLLADGLYAIPGVSLLFFLSWWFGSSFADLVTAFEAKVDHARPIIFLAIITAVVAVLLYKVYRKPVVEGDPKEIPLLGPPVARAISGVPDDSTAVENPAPPVVSAKPPPHAVTEQQPARR